MWTSVESPLGRLRLVATHGALTAIDFLDQPVPDARESGTVTRFASRAAGRAHGERADEDSLLTETAAQLAAYFAGGMEEFDLPVLLTGSEFQRRVWEQLGLIPYGEVRSYGEVARRLGLTGHGARAVGLANGRNPVPVVVPCHRVVGADGRLTGYGGGVARKELLLRLEQPDLFSL
jgi:methylated-DNA-[protein]-cysteine S-methyltransferase